MLNRLAPSHPGAAQAEVDEMKAVVCRPLHRRKERFGVGRKAAPENANGVQLCLGGFLTNGCGDGGSVTDEI